jgi:ribosomal protein S18 acetylase RimI-like enzyme
MSAQVTAGLTIRDARPDELEEVARLIRDAYQQYERFLPPSAWEAYAEELIDVQSRLDRAELIVAELDGKLAGSVTLFLKGSAASESGWPQDWAGIRLLAVLPAYRGSGIGRALMDECIRRCRNQGISNIGLHTTDMMEVAQRMYKRMGFKRAPEFDFYPRPDVVVKAYRFDL